MIAKSTIFAEESMLAAKTLFIIYMSAYMVFPLFECFVPQSCGVSGGGFLLSHPYTSNRYIGLKNRKNHENERKQKKNTIFSITDKLRRILPLL